MKWLGVGRDVEDSQAAGKLGRALDRNRGELAIGISDADFHRVIDTAPGLIWIALPNGENEWANQHYLDYVGLSLEQRRGWEWANAVHPDDLGRIRHALSAAAGSGEPGQAEARLRRGDGEYRWFLFRAVPTFDGNGNIVRWCGVNVDIEDQKRAEKRYRRVEAFLAEVQRLCPIGNFCWRVATGEFVCSEPLYRLLGVESGTPMSLDLMAARVHPEDMPLLRDMIERAQRGEGEFEYRHRIILADTSIKYVHLIAHRAQSGSNEIEYVGAVLDVTQRRLSEEALSRARSELAHLARVMSLGVLTASVAHEISQPLSGIITNAGTCLRMLAADPPNVLGARETARRTIRDGHRAAEVVTRLRALFSKRPIVIEAVDLNETARDAITLFRGDLEREGVVLSTELADRLPLVGGDRVQLQQVIMNLLRNAADAMRGIEGRPKEMVIRTKPENNGHVCLAVQDVGVGFGADDAERIFEAFYTTKSEGMGIGLSVSRCIIESHRGRLWAAPNDGPGASFAFTIPTHRGDEAFASS